jgi:predicted short-subunit dehydrogenase-like oxidoreductase (DUF2520 family)
VLRRELPDARRVPDDFFAAVERDDARVADAFFAAVERDDARVADAFFAAVERDDARVPDAFFAAVDRDDVERAVVREVVARRRDPPLARRSEAGISSVATALVSCGSSFCRKDAMRSSCLRNSRASFSVSLSPTVLASVSIAT